MKIDRSFLSDVDSQPRARAIVKAAVQLGHILDLSVVAEGIETEPIHEILVGFGCDVGQGWLYGRPEPGPDLLGRAPLHRPA